MSEEIPVAGLLTTIVAVLASALLLSLLGLVALSITEGDPGTRATLTHLIETIVGVFIGIAAGRLASAS